MVPSMEGCDALSATTAGAVGTRSDTQVSAIPATVAVGPLPLPPCGAMDRTSGEVVHPSIDGSGCGKRDPPPPADTTVVGGATGALLRRLGISKDFLRREPVLVDSLRRIESQKAQTT
jgi:hypothetical protein